MTGTKDTAAKTAKDTTSRDSAPGASFEVPAAMREFAELGIGRVKGAYDAYKTMAEDATGLLEDSFASVNQGVSALQSKALDVSRKNVDASFDYVARMLTVKSVAEAVDLQTRFMREQFDAMSQQAREFQDIAVRIQADAAKPLQTGMSKAAAQFQRGM